MADRLSASLGAFISICLVLPGTGGAQEPKPIDPPANDATLIRRQDWEAAGTRAPCPEPGMRRRWEYGIDAGPGKAQWHSGWPYGPTVAPPWGYYGLEGGPFVGYPWGWPYYSARAGQNWSNGLSLYGPPVPVYGPVPGIIGNSDLVHQWRDVPSLGIGYGWVGVYAASPRPRPLSVSAWPVIVEHIPGAGCPNGPNCATPAMPSAPSAPDAPVPIKPEPGKTGSDAPVPGMGTPLVLSVKVPQPTAEVFVDGHRTAQTGLDRTFESPPLEPGKQYRYELTARWVEGGAPREMKKAVVGAPGEVVRVDFTMP